MRIPRTVYLLVVAAAVLVFGLALTTQRFRGIAKASPPSRRARSSQGQQVLLLGHNTFGSFWMVGGGYSSTFIVRNKNTKDTPRPLSSCVMEPRNKCPR